MSKIAEIFRKNVARRLDELGIRPIDLAKRLNVSPSSLSPYIGKNATSQPGIGLLAEYADALECSPADLISDQTSISEKLENSSDANEFLKEKLAVISIITSMDEEDLMALSGVLKEWGSFKKYKPPSAG